MTKEQCLTLLQAIADMQTTLDQLDLRTERIERALKDAGIPASLAVPAHGGADVEGPVYIQPHILVMRDEDAGEEGVAHVEHQNALIVFRSADEVAKFRERTGMYEGFEAIPVDEVDIARTCIRHGLSQVCLPEPWTGENAVEFFDAEDFVKMLKDSAVEE